MGLVGSCVPTRQSELAVENHCFTNQMSVNWGGSVAQSSCVQKPPWVHTSPRLCGFSWDCLKSTALSPPSSWNKGRRLPGSVPSSRRVSLAVPPTGSGSSVLESTRQCRFSAVTSPPKATHWPWAGLLYNDDVVVPVNTLDELMTTNVGVLLKPRWRGEPSKSTAAAPSAAARKSPTCPTAWRIALAARSPCCWRLSLPAARRSAWASHAASATWSLPLLSATALTASKVVSALAQAEVEAEEVEEDS